ncbi:hypothetical protein QYE76_035929 [Lolium multiflorum]|uniref:Transposase (putative) gypsy type domain-containing protein n=1 Tax=Lolium multiflorum TaxID=4521 RepID=A0AAD8R0R7_LOLMU|nr:hypothetical protein QYE76_035929 [Lolium multiflorum]
MGQRSKQCKNRAPGTKERTERKKISGWERSKLSAQDKKMLKKMGLLIRSYDEARGQEFSPSSIRFRVIFVDFLIRGLSLPVQEFLRGLLFIYGIQLHQLTPNSLIHISIFITLCECFLGIQPHWGLWKRIFYLRHNNSRNTIYNVGGVCICVRPDDSYFDVKFADSVQEALHRSEERANDLEAKLKASEEARKKAEKDAASVEDLRQRLQVAVDALSDREAKQVERKMGEHYTLSQESDDRLLDALDILELNCDLARKCLTWTIALVAATGQEVNWVKAAAPQDLNANKWKDFVKGAKLYSKKLISFLDPKSLASATNAKTEVK